jgi:hypothetical protein
MYVVSWQICCQLQKICEARPPSWPPARYVQHPDTKKIIYKTENTLAKIAGKISKILWPFPAMFSRARQARPAPIRAHERCFRLNPIAPTFTETKY